MVVSFFSNTRSYVNYSKNYIFNYFNTLTVSFNDTISLFGFFIFLTIFSQLISGIMLAFSLVPESMLIPSIRSEEDVEDLYIDDFFWLHERGVDLLFIFTFIHLFRKLFLNINDLEQDFAWKSGAFSFLIIQVVVFLGLVLCCTHLSEITLTIAANALHSMLLFTGKVYWWFFTDRFLNTDTILRLAYLHYISAFFLAYLGLIHGVDMHYDWKSDQNYDGIQQELSWWDEVFSAELGKYLDFILLFIIFGHIIYPEPETLNYELFMWGDIGMITDIRFYGVAPHWYFRPYMAWLIMCPFHYMGIFGLIFFFVSIYFQPNILGFSHKKIYRESKALISLLWVKTISFNKYIFVIQRVFSSQSFYFIVGYSIFLIAIACALSYLPYGRFYNRIGGNVSMLSSFFYIFLYLGTTWFRTSLILNWGRLNLAN